jgi:hypothetical protein
MEDLQTSCTITYDESWGSTIPNVPRKMEIESIIYGEIARIIDKNNTSIDKWYLNRMDLTEDIPMNFLNRITTSEMYLNAIENHIASLINDAREDIKKQQTMIQSKMDRRKKSIESAGQLAIKDKAKEEAVLKRMQLLPDDLIRYIADFAFSPTIRLVFITQEYSSPYAILNRIKAPILTRMIPSMKAIINKFNTISFAFDKNKSLNKYKPTPSDPVWDSIYLVRYFTMNKTSVKEKKVNDFSNLFRAFHDIIEYYRQFTNSTFKKLQRQLIRLYHTIIYVSNHKCNKRAVSNRPRNSDHL